MKLDVSVNKLAGVILHELWSLGAPPTQWEGRTTDDRPVFIHYKGYTLTVCLGEVGQPEADTSYENESFRADDSLGLENDPGENLLCGGDSLDLPCILENTGLQLTPDLWEKLRSQGYLV